MIEFGGLEAKPEGTWLWYDPLVDLDENPTPTEARSVDESDRSCSGHCGSMLLLLLRFDAARIISTEAGNYSEETSIAA